VLIERILIDNKVSRSASPSTSTKRAWAVVSSNNDRAAAVATLPRWQAHHTRVARNCAPPSLEARAAHGKIRLELQIRLLPPGSPGTNKAREVAMRKALAVGAVAAIATLGTVSTAGAAPPGQEKKEGEVWICDGVETTILTSSGRTGWVGDTQYQATSIHFEGTFTPVVGDPETFTFDKTWPSKGGDEISCTQDVTETDETGTFVGHGEVTAVAVH
jgi:hypothetical protein